MVTTYKYSAPSRNSGTVIANILFRKAMLSPGSRALQSHRCSVVGLERILGGIHGNRLGSGVT